MAWTQLGPAGEPAPATSTADDMAAMRARWAEAHGRSPDLPSDVAVLWAEVGRLRAEVDRLRADLAEAQRAAADEILRRISEDEYGGRCEYHVIAFRDEVAAALSAGGADRTEDWRCSHCGSDRWVAASLTGPVTYGGKAIRQCIPCGHYSNDPVPSAEEGAG